MMIDEFEKVVQRVACPIKGVPSLSGVEPAEQFQPEKGGEKDDCRNINAAFIIILAGDSHPLFKKAESYLKKMTHNEALKSVASFYLEGVKMIHEEIETGCKRYENLKIALVNASSWCMMDKCEWNDEARENIWGLFFPQGKWCMGNIRDLIQDIRERRLVDLKKSNSDPVKDPAGEMLFTSNVLITVPQKQSAIDTLPLSNRVREQLKSIVHEDQAYAFDHPIQIDVKHENNEAVYGIRGLNKAVEFEKRAGGIMKGDQRLTCLLSVSVTHNGLRRVVRDYLKEVYAREGPVDHLEVYLFCETDCEMIFEKILKPASECFLKTEKIESLKEVFGVDGAYGRHYSFLKAISAFWKVFINPDLKGTYKFDLDQVFDQDALLKETGKSALEHFLTPLWGAQGTDSEGRRVDLGMMAGALVNEGDIKKGLFTPDVTYPDIIPRGESVIFFSPLAMAVSSRAEMTARYPDGLLHGHNCLQRVHVTGGTTAILVKSLNRYRPFTPTFIGRAEDQAYLLSCLGENMGTALRYLHKPGLIMRHDKESFLCQAVDSAKIEKYIGDLLRTIYFSYYTTGCTPWSPVKIKKTLDPFTGCFVTEIPFTVVFLRMALKAAGLFSMKQENERREGAKLIETASIRIGRVLRELSENPERLKQRYEREKAIWDLYYDLLENLDTAVTRGDKTALELKEKAISLISDLKVRFVK